MSQEKFFQDVFCLLNSFLVLFSLKVFKGLDFLQKIASGKESCVVGTTIQLNFAKKNLEFVYLNPCRLFLNKSYLISLQLICI